MQRQLPNAFGAMVPSLGYSSGPHVPQEHTRIPDEDSAPRDWSQLGRRVLAEAWRRLRDELAARDTSQATPVAPARREARPPDQELFEP